MKPSHLLTDSGARPNSDELATEAFGRAIAACHAQGGGEVVVPPGRFVTGTILLQSGVWLRLMPGAEVHGSSRLDDYAVAPHDIDDFRKAGARLGLVAAFDAHDIGIVGEGLLHGHGTSFMDLGRLHVPDDFDPSFTRQGSAFMSDRSVIGDGPVAYDARPGTMFIFADCQRITVRDVRICDSPDWTFNFADCSHIAVRGLRIENNLLVPNSDGIHCTSSRHITISDCDIQAGDDAIIFTGFGKALDACEHFVVTNCNLQSRSAAIRIGYGDDTVRNGTISNLNIYESNRGIGMFVRDRGSVEDILFSNLRIQTRLHTGHWWGRGEPIHLSVVAREPDRASELGQLRNIRFEGIEAVGESGIVLVGDPTRPLESVTIEGLRLTVKSGPLDEAFGGNFDLRPSGYPERALYKHDIAGIAMEHAQDITLRDVRVRWSGQVAAYCTNALEASDVSDVTIESFAGAPASETKAAVRLRNGHRIMMRGCRAEPGTQVFLAVEGSNKIGIWTSDLSDAACAVDGGGEVRIENCWMP